MEINFKLPVKFHTKDRIAFYEDISSFIKEGIPPFRAIVKMRDIAKTRKLYFYEVYDSIIVRLKEGKTLSEAVDGWIPKVEQVMLSSGEKTGRLGETMLALSEMLSKITNAKGAFYKICFTTAFLGSALLGVMFFVLNMVVPQASSLIPEKLMSTLSIAPYYLWIGGFILDNIIALLTAFGIYVLLLIYYLPRYTGTYREFLDDKHLPFTLYRMLDSSFFLVSVASMLESGLPVKDALNSFIKQSKGWSRHHYLIMMSRLKSGRTTVEAVDCGYLPLDISDRLQIYAMLPNMTQIMRNLGNYAIEVFQARIEKLGKAFNFIMMLSVAIFIISTIFSLGEISFAISDNASNAGR